MNNLFNYDNIFFTLLNKFCDILFLSLLWVILCIPVVTIGPATTAMYYATVKAIRRERGYVFREFFKSFRLNFKRGAIVGLIITVVEVVLVLDILASRTSITANITLNSILFGIYLAVLFFILCISLYAYPILSRFNMTVKQLIKAAVYMSLRHLLQTIAMLLMLVAAFAAVIFMPISIAILPVTITWLISLIMERILKKYIPKTEATDENSGKDEWYLE